MYFDTKYYVETCGRRRAPRCGCSFSGRGMHHRAHSPTSVPFGGGGDTNANAKALFSSYQKITHLVHTKPRTTPGAHLALRVRSKPRKSSCGTDCERRCRPQTGPAIWGSWVRLTLIKNGENIPPRQSRRPVGCKKGGS